MLTSTAIFFYEFPTRKKYGVPSHNFVKKNVLCEKGVEITRFDGTYLIQKKFATSCCVLIHLI
jgi:hypothetical protein